MKSKSYKPKKHWKEICRKDQGERCNKLYELVVLYSAHFQLEPKYFNTIGFNKELKQQLTKL